MLHLDRHLMFNGEAVGRWGLAFNWLVNVVDVPDDFLQTTPSGVMANCVDSSSTLVVNRGLSIIVGPATLKHQCRTKALFSPIQRLSRVLVRRSLINGVLSSVLTNEFSHDRRWFGIRRGCRQDL